MRTMVVGAMAWLALSACTATPGAVVAGAASADASHAQADQPETSGPPPLPAEVVARAQPVADADFERFRPIDEALWRAAFTRLIGGYPPVPRQEVACVAVGYEGNNTPYDPTPALLAMLEGIEGQADTRFLPASRCGFDIYPFVLGEGTPATLYSAHVAGRSSDGRLVLALSRTYGNLGGEGFEAMATRTARGWEVSPPVMRSIS
ncbi:hypothetical protein [Aurantiacibacter luteus]|uniref:Lipoprotein n=1 Tax=Aurantiacibacter luteus TaxID=1581420 RepID=A0A0G9MUN0_9SPHN|nr:hypothetical protein [Aurantiacibacter luteus]KLE34264.1 hypothetical protein AAW00_08370 [Aurantiacibacter luteus]